MKDRLPLVINTEVGGKKVLVRGDMDVDDGDNPRANSVREMVRWLLGKKAGKVKVIGHTGTALNLASQLQEEFVGVEFDDKLRDNPGETQNVEEFARRISSGWEV
ncbi:MAG: hypothetical protein UY33_C0032G0012 [Candidatus Amesbacteria bacterium GW2011_GWA1_48_9]|nr:MAG: hypothetical protein UY33_C0032G0012 [Candidatus Amesbacteria bacterium GW2011_GWA1_48_9]